MIVLTVTDCPPKLRGDLSKWLLEVNTGVYVGKVSSRVRDELWKRVQENLSDGRATMVFSTNNEQGMDFYVHNTTWIPVDYDGVKLVMRPTPGAKNAESALQKPMPQSHAALQRKIENIERSAAKKRQKAGYVVLDLETTGLDETENVIIELAAIRIIEHTITETLHEYVKVSEEIPAVIQEMTGITNDLIREKGIGIENVLTALTDFLHGTPVVSHNAEFEKKFLKIAYERAQMNMPNNLWIDTLTLARRYVKDVPNYKLKTLAEHFELPCSELHHALNDCETTYLLYEKLNEIR